MLLAILLPARHACLSAIIGQAVITHSCVFISHTLKSCRNGDKYNISQYLQNVINISTLWHNFCCVNKPKMNANDAVDIKR